MLMPLKDKQAQMDMEHRQSPEEKPKDPVEEITEEQFLKDLYLYMKRRDTPIERIPHLGFKQIDLFVMFNAVRELGGYHQVTSQQLWKQVYNTLGGNPRSTSAATCTRRHYEKLLLPYECHVKGILMSALPQHQPKHFHYHSYSNDDDDGPRPAKRRLLAVLPHQNLYSSKSDIRGKVFPMPVHYPHYYPPGHLSPYLPMPPSVMLPHSPPAPKPHFPVPSSNPNLTSSDTGKGPLEHLRELAENYKRETGVDIPLDLSIKDRSNTNPVSSFSPPSSKFLNEVPSLYTPQPLPVERNVHETQDDDSAVGGKPYSYAEEEKDAYIIDVKPASSSPTYKHIPSLRTEEDVPARAQKPSSPKTDFQPVWPKEERRGSPEIKRVDLSHILPNLPRDNGSKMEIEIPLSVLHKWLRMCPVEPSSTTRGPMQPTVLPNKDEHTGQTCFSETPPQISPKHQSPAAEDLRRRLSSTTPSQTAGNRHNSSSNHFTGYKSLPSGSILKNASSRDVYPADIIKSYTKPPSYWDAHDMALKTSPSPITVPQDYTVTKAYRDDTSKSGKEVSEMGPSTVLMVNSIPRSVLHLTIEEVMKLKRMISSSS